MNIQILNNDLSLFGIAAGFESVDFVRAFNSKGSFSLVINANNKNAKYIKIDKIAYLNTDKIGYIDKVTIQREGDKGSEIIIAEGVELKDRLNRVIYPDSSLINDSYTDEYLETVVKSLINKNAGYLASNDRQIPNLVTAADEQRGERIDYSAGYKDLSAEIYSLLSSQSMGLKAEIDFAENEIVFDVVQGEGRTAEINQAGGIVLSLDTKTALKIVDTDDKLSYKNLSVTAGLYSGSDRTVLEVGTEDIGYSRREVFTDARDVNTDDELAVRGAQKLSEISKTRAISVTANKFGSYKIGEHYDLGDCISVDAMGELLNAQVIKLKTSYTNEGGEQTEVVLNFDTDDTLSADIAAKHMDYNSLLASSARDTVAQVEIDEDASVISITGLDINADGGVYDVEIFGVNTSSQFVAVEINSITSYTNYLSAMKYIMGTISSGYTSPSLSTDIRVSGNRVFYIRAGRFMVQAKMIFTQSDGMRLSGIAHALQASNQSLCTGALSYVGSTNNITSILVRGAFKAGTVFRIKRCR